MQGKATRWAVGISMLAAAVATLAGGSMPARAAGDLTITFDDRGLAAIVHRGVELVKPDDQRFKIKYVSFVDATCKEGFTNLWDPQPVRQTFDAERKLLIQEYDWGRVECAYTVGSNRLDFALSLSNAAARPIGECPLLIAPLCLPNLASNDGGQNNTGWLGGNVYVHAQGTVGLVNGEFDQGATAFLDNRGGKYGARMIRFDGPRPENRPHHPVVDDAYYHDPGRPVMPGTTQRYRVSLVFGPPGATEADLCPELYAAYAKAHPMLLNWPDRRPIMQVFFSNSRTGWETNPRGYVFGKGEQNDVTTEAGLQVFGAALDQYADTCIAHMKSMDAQGLIVWDIEGQEMPHAVSYIGDPRALPQISPEMDRFADAFMQKIRADGFRTGVTIRPTEIYKLAVATNWSFNAGTFTTKRSGQPGLFRWMQRPVKDPVAAMSEKIAYAQKRWGCTIFYMDSNTFSDHWLSETQRQEKHGVPWIMPLAMIVKLRQLHPDCLIIPEHTGHLLYYTCSAPYSDRAPLGTDPLRRLWPTAFRVVAPDRHFMEMETQWDAYVEQVQDGDILLSQAGSDSPANEFIRWIYREADYRRQGLADSMVRMKLAKLSKKASDPEEATRFAVAVALGQQPGAKGQSILAALLDDTSPVVRKRALLTLAQGPAFNDPALVAKLVAWLKGGTNTHNNILRPFAADTLAKAGEAAVPELLNLLQQNNSGAWPYAIRAMGQTGTTNQDAAAVLLSFLDAKASDMKAAQRLATIEAVGRLRLRPAVPILVGILNAGDKEETRDQAVVTTLGRIGDPSCVEDLLKYWDAAHRPSATRSALNEALAAITSQNEVLGADEWRRWWKENQAACHQAP